MHDSAAGVTVFSDDGKCVDDAVIMRRALEYVKAFDGVVAQHAQEPRLTEGAQMNEGIVSAELGLGGWPAVAEESIIARDVLLAEHVGSRVHICHLSTAGSVEIVRWAKSTRHRRHRRGHPAPPAAHRRTGPLVQPRLQGQPAAAHRARRPGPARGTRRRHDRQRRHRPRPAPARGQGLRVGRRRLGMVGLETALSVVQRDDGRHRAARLGGGRRPDVLRPAQDRLARRTTAAPSRQVRPPTSRWSIRPAVDRGPRGLRLAQPQHPLRRA